MLPSEKAGSGLLAPPAFSRFIVVVKIMFRLNEYKSIKIEITSLLAMTSY